jgi:hypothetical protein
VWKQKDASRLAAVFLAKIWGSSLAQIVRVYAGQADVVEFALDDGIWDDIQVSDRDCKTTHDE